MTVFAAVPGTSLHVHTRPAGSQDAEELQDTLPVGGWVQSDHGFFVPLVPLQGTLYTFDLGPHDGTRLERLRALAERFGWKGKEVVRADVFLPAALHTGIQGQVHLAPQTS